MKIPKYIDRLIDKRRRLADELQLTDWKLCEWLDKNEIETFPEDSRGGAEMYVNPEESAERIREAIERSEKQHGAV